jgi:hypothetical protein
LTTRVLFLREGALTVRRGRLSGRPYCFHNGLRTSLLGRLRANSALWFRLPHSIRNNDLPALRYRCDGRVHAFGHLGASYRRVISVRFHDGGPHRVKRGVRMRTTFNWVALVVAGVALLIAAVGAILALLAGHARFIEVAWVSIAASLFVLASTSFERRE